MASRRSVRQFSTPPPEEYLRSPNYLIWAPFWGKIPLRKGVAACRLRPTTPRMASTNGFIYSLQESHLPGIIVCVVLLLMSAFSWTVMISKFLTIKRARHQTRLFLDRFPSLRHPSRCLLRERNFRRLPDLLGLPRGLPRTHLSTSRLFASRWNSRSTTSRHRKTFRLANGHGRRSDGSLRRRSCAAP